MNFKSLAMMLIFMLVFISGIHAATLLVDPATQDSPGKGEILTIRVNVKDVVDLLAYQFELDFDKAAMKFSSIEEGDFFKADNASTLPILATTTGESVTFQNINADIISKVNLSGALTVANLRYSKDIIKGIDGAGSLVTVKFEILEPKTSKLVLKNAFGDPERNPVLLDSNAATIKADLAEGIVNKGPECVKGDVNGDGSIKSNDAILALRISAELLLNPTSQQICAADVNSDGKVKSNDAITILRKAAGLASPVEKSVLASVKTIGVMLDEIYGIAGKSIIVPVKVDNTEALAGGDILIAYDSSVLRAVNVTSNSDILLAGNTGEAGIVRIAFAGYGSLNSKTLAEIHFDVISDSVSPITFQKVDLYRPDSLPLSSKKIDGQFSSWAIPPKNTALLQNFPNPFNPETWIPYMLKNDSEVTIRIYSAAGEMIRELELGRKTAGMYVSQDRAAYWDGKNKFGMPVASGIYFYNIKAGDFSAVKKLIILK